MNGVELVAPTARLLAFIRLKTVVLSWRLLLRVCVQGLSSSPVGP